MTCTVEYMKDGPEGDEINSKLEPVEVGTDDDGDAITSCVVVEAEPAKADTVTAGAKLNKNQQSMLTILEDAMPNGLTVDEWNALARDAGLGVTRRTSLMDWRSALKRKNLVHSYADRWYVTTR